MTKEIKQSVDGLSELEIAHISNMYLEQQRNELQQQNQHLLDLQRSMDKQYEELEQENQQLKGKLKLAEHNKEQSEIQCRRYRNKRKTLNHRIKRREQQRDKYKSVLDEIREYCNKYGANTPQEQDILQILDKVKE